MKLAFPLVAALFCVAVPAYAVPVAVTVVDPDGKPLVGTQIRAFEVANRFDVKSDFEPKTGNDGVFVWDWDGDFGAATAAEQKRSLRVSVSAPGMVTESRALRASQTTIVLQPARVWSGFVLDVNQKPLADVTLKLGRVTAPVAQNNALTNPQDAYLSVDDKITVTDANGRWTLAGLPARGVAELTVDDPRFGAQSFPLTIGAGDAAPIIAREGGSVTGVLLKPDGTPVAGQHVRVISSGKDVVTDAQGRFTIGGLPAGEAQLYIAATPPGNAQEEAPFFVFASLQTAQISSGKTTDLGEIKASATRRVTARFVDADTKAPLAEARLLIDYRGVDGKIDKDGRLQGRVTVDALSSVRKSLVTSNGYMDAELPLRLFDDQAETLDLGTIELKRGAQIRGTIRLEGGGDTSRLPTFFLKRDGKYGFLRPKADGTFVSDALEAGVYQVSTDGDKKDWQLVTPTQITVPAPGATAPDMVTEIVVKRLTPFQPLIREVRGRLLDADGNAVAGATVSARLERESGGTLVETATTDAQGNYLIKSGSRAIVGAQWESARDSQLLVSGNAARVEVRDGIATISGLTTKKRGVSITGRVVGADGKATANAWVSVVEARDFAPVQSGADGTFALADVPLDNFTLLAAHDRDWARVPAQSGAKNVELRLQTPAAADRAQAMARLLKLNGASAETLFANWEILGAAGVEQYIRRNGPPRAQIVALFGAELARREPAAFLNRAPELLQAMQGDPDAGEAREDLEAQLYLSRAATGAATNDAAARAEINGWLDEQKEIKREINARSVTRLLQMAAIAGKLKRQDAGQWLDYAAALATQLGSARGAESAWSVPLAGLGYDATARLAEGWDAPAEFALWASVAPIMARDGDIAGARRALARLQILALDPAIAKNNGPGNYATSPYRLESARLQLVGALASSDAPAAFELANQIQEAGLRSRALLKVADGAHELGNAELSEKALRQVTSTPASDSEIFALAASLGAQNNAQLGRELFALAREKAAPDEARQNSGFAQPSIAMWALYYAPIDAAQGRVLIEREWDWRLPAAVKDKGEIYAPNVNALYDLAKAMVTLDEARGAQMQAAADAIGAKAYNKATSQFEVAAAALATPTQRARLGVDARY